ncbi:UDP-N-acetylglucosamine 1-carboxyvinyltransferase [Nitratifractor sp.]|uniref:UDP-N-acetylglucosamine 1-carboxyvinyltransferase n=1 Tax=Nitratifractor sp. TaxID=2268144 RepID=UPI002600FC5D|nr:UDP-N-acetylglucosamine 1-carboxyvinyltransferase [Nitratifractor sp.]
MDYLEIEGGEKLAGSVRIGGAKNAALPVIAATLLSDGPVELSNVPDVVDIRTLLKLLERLGVRVEHIKNEVLIDCGTVHSTRAVYEIVAQMRASILVLGPLLSRFGECEVSLPGGCAIGQRPIDMHLKALESMGATIEIKGGYVHAIAPEGGLQGATILFDKVSVGATENTLMAAALAHGKTTIVNAALEPEIVQLCEMLAAAGVNIGGIGSRRITVEGTGGIPLRFPSPIRIIPDRIEAGTYLCAGAITRSEICLHSVQLEHLQSVMDKLGSMGCTFRVDGDSLTILPPEKGRLKDVNIVTAEYPGFPTDMQAQFMAVATLADGESLIEERLFENRFMHVSELNRLGADIWLKGNVAAIRPVERLYGAEVMATDLRASSALVLAALAAEGTTRVRRIYHLDRGYEDLQGKLASLGARIRRRKE